MDIEPCSQIVEGHHHHVHFTEDMERCGHHDSSIMVHAVNPSLTSIHLGFLQLGHRYEIKFQFECDSACGPLGIRNVDPPNLNVRVLDLQTLEDNGPARWRYEITLELFASKEKLVKEKVFLEPCATSSTHPPCSTVHPLTLELNARVLGKGKGTPLLKHGIRCIGVQMEEDSEFSDWQGF